jgi:hypothetical protein
MENSDNLRSKYHRLYIILNTSNLHSNLKKIFFPKKLELNAQFGADANYADEPNYGRLNFLIKKKEFFFFRTF